MCSPTLTDEDVEAIESGYRERETVISEALFTDIDAWQQMQSAQERIVALATLISVGSIDIRIALRPPSYGEFHEKFGIFFDELGNAISFKGSSNETWRAWHERGNLESFDVFQSWGMGSDPKRVEHHSKYFDRLWDSLVNGVEVSPFPGVAKSRLKKISKNNLDELDLDALDSTIDGTTQTEKVEAKSRTPFPHQLEAIESWKRAGRRGVFEHATGSGKTFTAIIAIRDHLNDDGVAIVLVPSRLLHTQWREELLHEIPSATLLEFGSGENRWRRGATLRNFSSSNNELGPRILLGTMQTASTDEFLTKVRGGEHLLVVADEVHEIGSPKHSKILSLAAGPRLGLSATPIRYGDPEGTQKIFDFFGPVIEPKFTLKDAIGAGRLVKYEYFPHAINLSVPEADAWRTISKEISLEVAKSGTDKQGSPIISNRAKMLMIFRSRIAKKAGAKVALAADIIQEHYREGEHWLLYCEDQDQLQQVRSSLIDRGISAREYHTSMEGDDEAELTWFRKHGGVLVSIRCLDQGVDIPEISNAVILASSQNPRQFIQRRGRVLRTAPDKFGAVVHDALVVPISVDDEPEQAGLLQSEFCRAIEFAETALNLSARAELRDIAIAAGFDPNRYVKVGIEDEEV